jgi:hypothetical protein
VAAELRTQIATEAQKHMWRHIEPDRLYQGAQGAELLDSESDHLVSCEICHELLIFFEEQIKGMSGSETKAA